MWLDTSIQAPFNFSQHNGEINVQANRTTNVKGEHEMKKSPIVLIAVTVVLVYVMKNKPEGRTILNANTEFANELTPFISDGINAQSQMGRLIRELLQ